MTAIPYTTGPGRDWPLVREWLLLYVREHRSAAAAPVDDALLEDALEHVRRFHEIANVSPLPPQKLYARGLAGPPSAREALIAEVEALLDASSRHHFDSYLRAAAERLETAIELLSLKRSLRAMRESARRPYDGD